MILLAQCAPHDTTFRISSVHLISQAYKAIEDPLALLKRKLKQRTSGPAGMLKIFKKFRDIASSGESIKYEPTKANTQPMSAFTASPHHLSSTQSVPLHLFSFRQFKLALYKMELRVSDIECRKAFAKLDTDHSGEIGAFGDMLK